MNGQPVFDPLSFVATIGLFRFSLLATLAFISLSFTLIALLSHRRPMALSMLPYVIALPLLVSVFLASKGIVMSFMVISTSSVTIKPSEIAEAMWIMIIELLVSVLLCLPAYVTAVFGLVWKSLRLGPAPSA